MQAIFSVLLVCFYWQQASWAQSLRIVTVNDPPFQVVDPQTKTVTGLSMDFLQEIQKLIPLNYTLSFAADGHYGAKEDGGQWNGMIGELVAGRADMALGSVGATDDRKQVAQFSTPYKQTGRSLLIKKPACGTPIPAGLEHAIHAGYKFLAVPGNSIHATMTSPTQTNLLYKKIGQSILANKVANPPTAEADWQAMIRNSSAADMLAFVSETPYNNLGVATPPCDLVRLPQFDHDLQYAFAFAKNYAQFATINAAIEKLTSQGVYDKLFDKYFGVANGCKEPQFALTCDAGSAPPTSGGAPGSSKAGAPEVALQKDASGDTIINIRISKAP